MDIRDTTIANVYIYVYATYYEPSFLDYIVANLISDSIKDKKTLIVVSGV